MTISEYEHLEEAFLEREWSGITDAVVKQPETIWITRRRHDGKVFLATELDDSAGLIDRAGEQFKRLLSHPNLVRLIDIVSTTPEGLCWHVPNGTNQALLYLHTGRKRTRLWNRQMVLDDDWQGTPCVDVSPATIYFKVPKGKAMYGSMKLGRFRAATITSDGSAAPRVTTWRSIRDSGTRPFEIQDTHPMTPAGEVWALGAVLYHMMVGRPPEERNMQETIPQDSDYPCYYVDAIPNAYSSELRAIVYEMLKTEPEQRPTALQLSPRIGAALGYWRDKTAEEYILK
ncbi:MAG: hypothetical protein M1813_000895 [Trichoglossum hirsutum]|nr:MAG: hypothetical protein M1813_000895 [Trichoglossum hirsutum]